jgi:transcriptional regulator with XRE-family HTH domain
MPEVADPKVGKALRRKRRRLEITAEYVGSLLGVSRQRIIAVEREGATPSMAERYEDAIDRIIAARKADRR